MRLRTVIAGAALAVLLTGFGPTPGATEAGQAMTVGLLPFTSSGPVFVALDQGYFREEGIDAELVLFQAAPPIALATAAGEVQIGVTALSAAVYNLAGSGRLKLIAGQAQERKGYSGNLILVTRAAYDRGLDRPEELLAEPLGITQPGSPSHYQAGQLAMRYGEPSGGLDVRSFQTLPNLVAALKSGAVTWAIIAPPIATDLVASGSVVSLGPYSDHGAFQFGAVMVSTELIAADPDLVRRFLRAYRRGLADYARMLAEPDDPAAVDTAAVVGRHVYPDLPPAEAAAKVLASALYVDPEGDLDEDDVARQVSWYTEQGMVKPIDAVSAIFRLDLLGAQ